MENWIRAQFQVANEKYEEGDWEGAIKDYSAALANYPERKESVSAIERIAEAYMNMIVRSKDEQKKRGWRLDLEAVEGYLGERFGGVKDKSVMIAAGDAVLRLAAKEKDVSAKDAHQLEEGERDRSKALYRTFLSSYTRHTQAPSLAAAFGYEAQKKALDMDAPEITADDDPESRAAKAKVLAERNALLEEALDFYGVLESRFPKSSNAEGGIFQMSVCHEKLGNREKAIEYMKKYVDRVSQGKSDLAKMKAQMNLAVLYQKDGFALIAEAEDSSVTNAADLAQRGTMQCVKGIREFMGFAKTAKERIENPGVAAKEKEEYGMLREGALYLAGDCWNRLKTPTKKLSLESYRAQAAKNFEAYVEEYPKGRYAKPAYVKLGRIYSQSDDVEKAKSALMRLKKAFPDSEEARKAMPQLATSLVEYAKTLSDADKVAKIREQACAIYAEMLENGRNEYRPIDYVHAGEILIEAENWNLAGDAFAKAESTAGTNQPTVVARARLGRARSFVAQKNYVEARESLDEFLEDERMKNTLVATNAYDMLSRVALEQGLKEKDESTRRRHFGKAIGAVKNLTAIWSRTNELGQARVPRWQIDRVTLTSSDISMAQMEAEANFGNRDAADKARTMAMQKLQTFIMTREPTDEKPFDQYGARDRENLEKAYADMVSVLSGTGFLDEIVKYGAAYDRYFPNGARAAEVHRAMQEAYAKGAKAPDGAKAPEGEVTPAEESATAEPQAEEPAEAQTAEPASEEPAAEEPAAEEPAE